ncbi:MAG: lysophospholipid transporter LplT [Gammaproteobacteria bacterium]|nr:MAG: lysophospholipid transporter LplT [Gammaproteobacteria bacterium]
MKGDVRRVLLTQFLSALADNAMLFAVVTLVLQRNMPAWYVPALQAAFLLAYVIGAPWVGRLADAWPKRRVLWLANLLKLGGVGLMLMGAEPLLAYAVVGAGAALYSPAKYGILPELVDRKALLRANGWIEAATILAILGGTWFGALLAQASMVYALLLIGGLYLASIRAAMRLRHDHVAGVENGNGLLRFGQQMRLLLATPRARFATLGVSLFWGAATILRVALVAWAPAVLYLTDSPSIALLSLFVAVGIAIGALLAPRLIPPGRLRRARMAAYAMGGLIILLAIQQGLAGARLMLFLAGVAGGLFVVPINAALQEIGHRHASSGGAVAIQNFFENLTMLVASGLYAFAAGQGADPVAALGTLGAVVMLATLMVAHRLPQDTQDTSSVPAG